MATTTPINTAAQDAYAALNGTTKKTTTTAVEDQQNRFLKLLTTQLQNQDPLNPVDNAETTSQLAQISTVDGITKLNTTLEKMMASYQSSEAMQAAALVGHSVLVEGSGLKLEKSMAAGGIELEGVADNVSVSILDSNGLEVDRIDLGKLDAGTHTFTWDGKTSNDTIATDGSYTVKVTATQGSDKVTVNPLELATVGSVVTGGSEVQVDVGRLGRVSVSDIKLIL